MSGILADFFEKRAVSVVPESEWRGMGSYEASTGVKVTPKNALQISAVFACVRILAESVASLPLILYERLPDEGKARAAGHPLYPLLHDLPNPEMTSFTLRETMMGHLGLWGNAYAEIEYNRAGEVRALWPLRVDKMERIERDDSGRLIYIYELPRAFDSELVGIPASRILHVRGLGHNGLMGFSPLALQRHSIGLALATEKFGAALFKNGARPKVILRHPGKMSDEAQKRLQRNWNAQYQGLENAHRTAIVEEGMEVAQVGIPPNEAQFLETRKFQIQEVARWYRVPPHMLADLDRATFSNIEHQSLDFVIHTLTPWLERWEQEIFRSLLTPSERTRYFVEHLVTALLRGDIASRYEAYAVGRSNGWLSANDIRKLENMNPIEGGDVYLVPLNMIPADQVGDFGSSEGRALAHDHGREHRDLAPREIRSARSRHRLQQAHARTYRDALARILRREVNDIRGALEKQLRKRSLFEFRAWLDAFYREHETWVAKQLRAATSAYAELVQAEVEDEVGTLTDGGPDFIRAYLERYAARHVGKSLGQVREALDEAEGSGGDAAESVERTIEGWPEGRARGDGNDESVRFGNALAVALYGRVGVRALRWVAFGENCPYCSDLNGRVVGIEEWFIGAGESLEPEGAERPLTVSGNVGHAPAHGGCDCMVVSSQR